MTKLSVSRPVRLTRVLSRRTIGLQLESNNTTYHRILTRNSRHGELPRHSKHSVASMSSHRELTTLQYSRSERYSACTPPPSPPPSWQWKRRHHHDSRQDLHPKALQYDGSPNALVSVVGLELSARSDREVSHVDLDCSRLLLACSDRSGDTDPPPSHGSGDKGNRRVVDGRGRPFCL